MTVAPGGQHAGGRQARIPLVRPDLPETSALLAPISTTLATGIVTKGDRLREFEDAAAALIGCRHVVAVSSCTVGLALVLRSLAALAGDPVRDRCDALTSDGGKPTACPSDRRDEVILPSFIFLAAPAAIAWAGLKPVFVDVSPADYTVTAAAVEAAISDRTAAILTCHTFGCPCDMIALQSVADRAGVPLLADAAHGLGSRQHGRQVGREGLAQVFSLSPTKLVVAGEGGLVATSCDRLAHLIRMGREYGNDGDYGCWLPGLNGRMPEISAILGQASLERLDEVWGRRAAAAEAYRSALDGTPGIRFQAIPAGCRTSWKDFTIAIEAAEFGMSRDEVSGSLAAQGIETRAYYSPPCHRMEAFRGFVAPGRELPVTDNLAGSLLALPMGAHVTTDVALEVAFAIRSLLPATATPRS